MQYSVCLNTLFPCLPYHEGIEKVKESGFSCFECWLVEKENVPLMKQSADENHIMPLAMCTDYFTLNDRNTHAMYVNTLENALEKLSPLHPKMVITQVGQTLNTPLEEQLEAIVEGLKLCIPVLKKHNAVLVFEPLNTKINHKGYALEKAKDAFFIAQKVNSPFVKVLYDIYHQYVTENCPVQEIVDNIHLIGHFHMANGATRKEPFLPNDPVDYVSILREIKKAGYTGYVGLEYDAEDGVESLKRVKAKLESI